MNQTASQNAEEFGFEPGDIVQEWLWDDDVDDSIRAQIEELTGEDLVDEDYDSAVDGVIVWWRDGDDEDELSDTIVDAYAVLAVRCTDRRYERRHPADRQLGLERHPPARIRQGPLISLNQYA